MKKLNIGDKVTTVSGRIGIVEQVAEDGYDIRFEDERYGLIYYSPEGKYYRDDMDRFDRRDLQFKKGKRKLPDWF